MIKVFFKDLEKSDFAKYRAEELYARLSHKFPELKRCKATITLSEENAPGQSSGQNMFTAKFTCQSGRYKGISLERSASNMNAALSDLSDSLFVRLNRFGERERTRRLKIARRLQRGFQDMLLSDLRESS